MTKLLENINGPKDLKKIEITQLPELAEEIRELMIDTCSKNGGHIGTNLGVVELTIAMHYVFNSPEDKIIFDTSHQSYTHKILTGRKESFKTICKYPGGIPRFIVRGDNEHDFWSAGHASTALSGATGFAEANKKQTKKGNVICLMGDGALSGGMVYEALNNIGYNRTDITIILNDNKMSISPNVGAMIEYLSKLSDFSTEEKGRRNIATIFEKMGIKYFGAIDGHNFEELIENLEEMKQIRGPKLLHVITQKGKGMPYMEQDKARWHEHAAFDRETGVPLSEINNNGKKMPKTESIAIEELIELAKTDEKIIGITAAMPDGTALSKFGEKYPKQFYDVGIAEEHAVTFAAGLAAEGLKPFVAIYSPFMQRAFDQISHDVAMQKLPVRLLLPKASLTGDGPTQGGVLDLSYLRIIPDIVIMAPSNEQQMCDMIKTAYEYEKGPIAIRYPKIKSKNPYSIQNAKTIPIGVAEIIQQGNDITIISIGMMLEEVMQVNEELKKQGINAEIIDSRFAKPLDEKTIIASAKKTQKVITIEENTLVGGFGTAVLELFEEKQIHSVKIKRIGVKDEFIGYDTPENLKKQNGMDKETIINEIKKLIQK